MQPYGKKKRKSGKTHSHDKCDVCSDQVINKKRERQKAKKEIEKDFNEEEKMKCPVCNNEVKEKLYKYIDKKGKVYDNLKMYRCTNEECKHQWMPFEEEIKVDFFREGYEEWKKKKKLKD